MDAAPSVSPVSLPLTLEATGTVLTGLGHCLRLSVLLSFDTKEKAGQALAGCRGITIPLRLSVVGCWWVLADLCCVLAGQDGTCLSPRSLCFETTLLSGSSHRLPPLPSQTPLFPASYTQKGWWRALPSQPGTDLPGLPPGCRGLSLSPS